MIKEETILLLNFNGSNNSTTFSEETGKTVVANGDVKISTAQSVFGGASGYFDGTGDYLSFYTQGKSWDFSKGDWTLECWIYPTSVSLTKTIFLSRNTTYAPFSIYINNGYINALASSGTTWNVNIGGTTLITANTWNHIAFIRYRNLFILFLNGVIQGSTTHSSDLMQLPAISWLGRDNYPDFNGAFIGYIDSFRLIKGRALYTESFTVPTEQFQYDPYYDYTSLLIPFDGPNNSTVFGDYSLNRNIITAYGDAKISTTQSVFGGSSGYFDGTGDYLSILDSSLFVFGLADFTIECWIKTSTANKTILDRYMSSIATNWQIFITSSGYLQWYTSTPQKTGSVVVTDGNWHHIAIVRSNNILNFYVDGVIDGSGSNDYTNYSTSVTYLGIGAQINSRNAFYDFNGYIEEVRITKGAARYTGNFTVPSKSFYKPYNYDPFFDKVSLLLHMDGDNNSTTFKDGSINDGIITTFGNSKISTTQSKIGGSSGYFDGSGDYLSTPTGCFNVQINDFTIEMWFYPTSSTVTYRALFYSYDNHVAIYQYGTSVHWYYSGQYCNSAAFLINTWHHLAVVRKNGVIDLYFNGVKGTSYSSSLNMVDGNIYIGANSSGGDAYIGYIDELRITKDIARYSVDFTPPTFRFYDLIKIEYFYGVYNEYLICKPGESLGDHKNNSIIYIDNNLYFDTVDYGEINIYGYYKIDKNPVHRKIRLCTYPNHFIIRETWSDPITGLYSFNNVKKQDYILIFEDYENLHHSKIRRLFMDQM